MKLNTRMSLGAVVLAVTALGAMWVPAVEGQQDPRARLFVERGCSECHAVAGLGLKAKADVAPDLTYAYGDVLYRYGLTLERFLDEPVGAMRLVFGGGHVRLSRVDSDSVVHILRGLYRQGLAKRELPGCKEAL